MHPPAEHVICAGKPHSCVSLLQGEPWVSLGIGRCQLIYCRCDCPAMPNHCMDCRGFACACQFHFIFCASVTGAHSRHNLFMHLQRGGVERRQQLAAAGKLSLLVQPTAGPRTRATPLTPAGGGVPSQPCHAMPESAAWVEAMPALFLSTHL